MAMLISPDQLHQLFLTYGYWAVAIVVGLESVGLPLPGEAVLVAASAYAASHNGNLAEIIIAATIGAIVGDNIGFLVGTYLGYPVLQRFGSYIGITDKRLKVGQYLFLRYGGWIVFFGRFIAVLRVLAAFLAGVNRLPWPTFVLANAAGAIIWSSTVAIAGYVLGHQVHVIHGPMSIVGITIGVIATVAGLLYMRRHETALLAAAEKELHDKRE
jgi:membrane protein DedA with SNARE-associated domain